MDSRRSARMLAAIMLTVLAVLHLLWMATPWPCSTWDDLARAVVGTPGDFPSPGACLMVAVALAAAAAFTAGLGANRWIGRAGRLVVVAVLAARGVGGLALDLFSPPTTEPFASLDLLLYSPLCLLIAALVLLGWWGALRRPAHVHNVHTRSIAMNGDRARAMLDTLGTDDDLMWRTDLSPAMAMSNGPQVGSEGGHGAIRYHVTRHEPGHLVEYTFEPGLGLNGTHTMVVEPGSTTVIRHWIEGEASGLVRWLWGPLVERIHDGVIEDIFDHVERACTGQVHRVTQTPTWVRALGRRTARAEAKQLGAVVRA